MKHTLFPVLVLFLAASVCLSAGTTYQPYIRGTVESGNVKTLLKDAGFQIVGEYTPYDSVTVIAITNDTLKNNAALTPMGGFGAVERVAFTSDQVVYTNPVYWALAYRLKGDLSDIKTLLEKTLGNAEEFGSEDGLTAKKLKKYHYMMAMPYFDDAIEVATYKDHDKAVKIVEEGLKTGRGNTRFVYRVDIPGGRETVFGMGLLGDHDGADAKAIAVLNTFTGKHKHLAYFPYEILVSGGKVLILHGKFRIALSFPDLSMGQFMKIRGAPGGIEDAAEAVAKPE